MSEIPVEFLEYGNLRTQHTMLSTVAASFDKGMVLEFENKPAVANLGLYGKWEIVQVDRILYIYNPPSSASLTKVRVHLNRIA